MVTTKKSNIVKELSKKFSEVKGVVFADHSGFSVQEMAELRNRFRESGIEFKVIKNTLSKIALKKVDIEGLDEYLIGPTSAAFSYSEPILAAKILKSFNIDGKALTIKAGYIEGEIFGQDEMIFLAELPSRTELITNLIMNLSNPINKFVRVLKSPLVNFINQVRVIKESKDKQ